MGEKYALMEGHHPEVAKALREQFLPDAAGGVVPETLPGALLATAEKVDNIVAAFACGEPPSGSKDPYGLRRAAAGMVAIAAKHGLRYDVEKLVERAYDGLEKFPDWCDRARSCPRRRPSSSNGWPRRSPTTASLATPWTRCCPPRATSSTCAPGPRPCSASARVPLGRPGDGVQPAGQPGQEAARPAPRRRPARPWEACSRRSSRPKPSGVLMGEWWQAAGEAGIAVEKRDYAKALGAAGRAAPVRGQVLRRRAGHGRGRGRAAEPAAAAGRGGRLRSRSSPGWSSCRAERCARRAALAEPEAAARLGRRMTRGGARGRRPSPVPA